MKLYKTHGTVFWYALYLPGDANGHPAVLGVPKSSVTPVLDAAIWAPSASHYVAKFYSKNITLLILYLSILQLYLDRINLSHELCLNDNEDDA